MRNATFLLLLLVGVILVGCDEPSAQEWREVVDQSSDLLWRFEFLESRINSYRFTLALKATYGMCFNHYADSITLEKKVSGARAYHSGYNSGVVRTALEGGNRDTLNRVVEGLESQEGKLKALEQEGDEFPTKSRD